METEYGDPDTGADAIEPSLVNDTLVTVSLLNKVPMEKSPGAVVSNTKVSPYCLLTFAAVIVKGALPTTNWAVLDTVEVPVMQSIENEYVPAGTDAATWSVRTDEGGAVEPDTVNVVVEKLAVTPKGRPVTA